MTLRTFSIPATKIVSVEAQFIKLNKRALKLNVTQFTWSWGKASADDKDLMMVPLNIEGPFSVFCGDFKFIATLQHLSTGENVLRKVEDVEIPRRYRDAKSDCEHCKVNRYRKDTYLMEHKNGSIMQVGSSCLDKFLGTNSPEELIKQAQLASDAVSYLEGTKCAGFAKGDESIYPMNMFLAVTNAVIRELGWVSKGKAAESGQKATAYIVVDNLNAPPNIISSLVTSEDLKLAIEAEGWAENIPDDICKDSDYLYNIRAIARSGMVGRRTAGFAASIINAYKRDLPDDVEKKVSQYVGTKKQRSIFKLTLCHQFPYSGSYGPSTKFIFEDENNNVMVWNCTNGSSLKTGETYMIKGTILAHTDYKGVNQTLINRCEVVNG